MTAPLTDAELAELRRRLENERQCFNNACVLIGVGSTQRAAFDEVHSIASRLLADLDRLRRENAVLREALDEIATIPDGLAARIEAKRTLAAVEREEEEAMKKTKPRRAPTVYGWCWRTENGERLLPRTFVESAIGPAGKPQSSFRGRWVRVKITEVKLCQ